MPTNRQTKPKKTKMKTIEFTKENENFQSMKWLLSVIDKKNKRFALRHLRFEPSVESFKFAASDGSRINVLDGDKCFSEFLEFKESTNFEIVENKIGKIVLTPAKGDFRKEFPNWEYIFNHHKPKFAGEKIVLGGVWGLTRAIMTIAEVLNPKLRKEMAGDWSLNPDFVKTAIGENTLYNIKDTKSKVTWEMHCEEAEFFGPVIFVNKNKGDTRTGLVMPLRTK